MHWKKTLQKHKYLFLLAALMQHLFTGMFFNDIAFYTRVLWPINMLVLGLASTGIFLEKGKSKNIIRTFLFVLLVVLPLVLPFFPRSLAYMEVVSVAYVTYFIFTFWEVLRFLIRPGYIDTDIISAAGCGYFLLLEIAVFLMQLLYYSIPSSFSGIDATGPASVYIDLVYFCTITLTSIGFGDILPHNHVTKLLTALFDIIGQFYSVVLVGILISKFSSSTNK